MQGPSWSSVDAGGHWRLLHYRMQHLFAPMLVSGVYDAEAQAVHIHVTNDNLHGLQGTRALLYFQYDISSMLRLSSIFSSM